MQGENRVCESKEPLIDDKELQKIFDSTDFSKLRWNHYLEDIGEGRKYRGQWLKRDAYVIPKDSKKYQDDLKAPKPNPDYPEDRKGRKQWTGFGIIFYPDGSKYQG